MVTTPIGAEGMHSAGRGRAVGGVGGVSVAGEGLDDGIDMVENADGEWGGLVESDPDAFAAAAVWLYLEKEAWVAAQSRARTLLRELYPAEENLAAVGAAIQAASEQINERRGSDYAGAVLWQQSARSTEYFSRWIELKEAAARAKAEGV